jgi:hypothetical protein
MSYYSEAAKRFLAAFNEAEARESVFAGVAFDFDERRPGTVEIRHVTAAGPRGAGRGTAAIRRVCELADGAGVSLYVQPHSQDPAIAARLEAWYRREGFSEESGEGRLTRPAPVRAHDIGPAGVREWALARGFRRSGVNAYSATHRGFEYQIVLRQELLHVQRKRDGRVVANYARTEYRHLRIDEHGMLLHAGLCEAFVREMSRGEAPPPWFPPAYVEHARETIIPGWEAALERFPEPPSFSGR